VLARRACPARTATVGAKSLDQDGGKAPHTRTKIIDIIIGPLGGGAAKPWLPCNQALGGCTAKRRHGYGDFIL